MAKAKLTRKFDGKTYHRTGTYYTSKRQAEYEAGKLRRKGHLVRIITTTSHIYPKSMSIYQLWITL